MLNALSVALAGSDPDGQARARRSLIRQGFARGESFNWGEGALDTWSHPSQAGVADTRLATPAGIACCVGPLWYRGRFGIAALRVLLAEGGEALAWDDLELRGNFALFLFKGPQQVLLNDAPGFVRIYASADKNFYSTSWLATCAYTGVPEVDADAAVEYVLLGASHSVATVARGINTLRLGQSIDLAGKRTVPRSTAGVWVDAKAPASLADAAEASIALLRTIFNEAAAAFPARIRTALSGGFDSRLILAALLAADARPELFVYGTPDSADVRIARTVAEATGLHLDVIDKGQRARDFAAPDLERVVRNALFFDGLPNDGVHDSGVDARTRLEQSAEGWLSLNGGGGEIFRNYFHLPDRPFRAIDVVRTFYRGFDARVFRRADGLRAYEDRMVASMEQVLHLAGCNVGPKLTRDQVELLYPLFRCHYWMGVNNSIAARHGYNMTPLVESATVRSASRLPLAWKNAGVFESRLIASLHAGVAGQPSEYGFRFTDGPDWHARRKEWATRARPVFARPLIGALHRRLGRQGVAPDMITRCRALLQGEWRMDPILDVRYLPDDGAFGRALAVEVVWRELLG